MQPDDDTLLTEPTTDSSSTPDDNSNDQPILAHMTNQRPLPPGQLQRLLSPTAAKHVASKPQELKINGTTFRQVNMGAITYRVSTIDHHCDQHVALVDRGANGSRDRRWTSGRTGKWFNGG